MLVALEKEILQLEGIISCRVTGDEDLHEIHIVAREDRNPKRIVRDVETITLVNTGEKIDHKKISIAQVADKDSENIISPSSRIELISIYQKNKSSDCYFELKINDKLIEEKISGDEDVELYIRVAEGLLEIIEKYTGLKDRLKLKNAFITGEEKHILVVEIQLFKDINSSNSQELIGSAYINHNLPLATGKACLKAFNRQLANQL